MKLNFDCVHDVLLFLESADYLSIGQDDFPVFVPVGFNEIFVALPAYSPQEIFYCLHNLAQAGFVDAEYDTEEVYFAGLVNFITFAGHEFLALIKPPAVWEKTKDIASIVGSESIQILTGIAKRVIREKLGEYFNDNSSSNDLA